MTYLHNDKGVGIFENFNSLKIKKILRRLIRKFRLEYQHFILDIGVKRKVTNIIVPIKILKTSEFTEKDI